ncbi:F-box protein [Zea mays]|uniref:F-box protein n=1 Tax=Zea mays TaxID=4577 RepID=A0A1D6MAG3_MAIZE|nr:F-box protein [Zea mays]
MNYSIFFGLSHLSCNNIPVSGVQYSTNSVPNYPNFSWKESFHTKYAECASWKFVSNRALCAHCRSVIWLSNLTCASPHHCPKNRHHEVKLRPLLPDTVSCLTLHDLAHQSFHLIFRFLLYHTGERASSLAVKDFRVAPPSPEFDSYRERIFRLG